MESEWDEEEDERPNLTLRVSAMDIRSSPAVTRPATTVRDMTNPKNVRQSAFLRSLASSLAAFRSSHPLEYPTGPRAPASLRDVGDDSVPPGIKEKEKKLRHELEGEVCGGIGDRSAVKDFAKKWKGGLFTRADSANEYRKR